MEKYVNNIKFDNDFERYVLNGFDINEMNTGKFHVELFNITRVESTLICGVCKDSYVQQSQRYVRNDESMFRWMTFDDTQLNDEFKALCRQSMSIYERMTELKPESVGKTRTTIDDYKWGIPIEDARYMLPLACKTNMSITMSGDKFELFVALLYFMSDSISKFVFDALMYDIQRINIRMFVSIRKMLKKYGKGNRNPVKKYFKNTLDFNSMTPSKYYTNDVDISDLAVGTLMSSASDPVKELEENYSDFDKQLKLVLRVAKKGHYSILEQVRFTTDTCCSLTCYHQLIRHRLYNIMPMGLIDLGKSKCGQYMIPETIRSSKFFREADEIICEWSDFIHRALISEPRNYNCLGALLNCQIIPFKLNTNIRADIDVMKQRLCMNAQWEIRQFMEDRKTQLGSTTFAPIYKAFAKPNCQTIGCQEGNYAHPECQKSGRCNNKKVDSE